MGCGVVLSKDESAVAGDDGIAAGATGGSAPRGAGFGVVGRIGFVQDACHVAVTGADADDQLFAASAAAVTPANDRFSR